MDFLKMSTRRDFLRTGVLGAATIGFPTIVPSTVLARNGSVPPSERVNIGLIGCGNIVKSTPAKYHGIPSSQLLAVCDPWPHKRNAFKTETDPGYANDTRSGSYNGCVAYADFRDLLANKDIDGVQISTGDYWHVPISILAARAGKDLHTEKPLGLCIHECLQMERAVRKYDRVFQYGTEGRSMAGSRLGVEMVLNGHIGEVQRVYAWAPPGRGGGKFTPAPIPDGFDYDLWLGPAPEAGYSPGRCKMGGNHNAIFHYYDYAIGFIAGWGAHPIDLYQWWADQLGIGIPNRIRGKGVIPKEGAYNTITNWDVSYQHDKGPDLRFMDSNTAMQELPEIEEVTGLNPKWDHGVIFIGTKGQLHLQRGGFATSPAELRQLARNPGPVRLRQSKLHERDWVDAIRKRETPVSDVASAVRSDIICHLGDIAIRTGRTIQWDDARKAIINDDASRTMMFRSYRKPWSVEV